MQHFFRLLALFLFLGTITVTGAFAQTFRGGIAGTLTDTSGAVVPNVKLVLVNKDTGLSRETVSTSSGDYSFPDLPLGNNYSVSVDAAGFQPVRIAGIAVRPGQVYSLPVHLTVAVQTMQVEVNAAAAALDLSSSTNTAVVTDRAVQNIPLNGRDFTQLLKIVPGYNGAGSLNGTRTNQNNWQIDGTDNNDLWQNGAAANQSGVSGIAGVVLPIDAIDQFSVQSQSNAENGRNGGGTVNMVIKSGTNQIHGTAYYFNRNEAFAVQSPFVTGKKPKLRNNQWGGSVGGPIRKDKDFYFFTFERQNYVIGSQSAATEPTTAWVNQATAVLNNHGVAVNQAMLNGLSLWPQGNKDTGAAVVNNYYDARPQTGYSDNGVLKLDHNITDRQTISARAFIGTGVQTGNVGTNVYDYYQVAPDHVQNYSVVHNWAISSHLTNQLLFGVGTFAQTFSDANHSQNVPALGINTGVTNPTLFGAPNITITGFDNIGVTPPLGRKDITGHVDETLSYTVGKHQFRFGGEFRRSYMNLLYQRNVRGNFSFDGTSSTLNGTNNWVSDSVSGETKALADYLAGYVATSSIVRGNLVRDIYVNSFDLFAQDQYQLNPHLSLNYGLRYTYNGPFYSTAGQLSTFRPDISGGLAVDGQQIDSIYPRNWTNAAPRFGFAFQPGNSEKVVIRGGYGVFFDVPNLNGFFDNRPGNGGAVGVQANPTATDPVYTINRNAYQIVQNAEIFPTSGRQSIYGIASVSQNFRTAYVQNFNLNTEIQLGRNTIAQLGYTGSLGRRLIALRDINQAAANTTRKTIQSSRPYYSQYPTFAAINQIQSIGGSNYSSLQAMVRTSGWHSITAQASYTYGHALDNVSGTRGFAPQDSNNFAAEYGNASFDVRHTFNGYIVYEVPKFTDRARLLSQGWQVNSFMTFYTGSPVNVKTSQNISGTGEFQDRVNLVSNPSAGLSRSFTKTSTGGYVQWFKPTAFALPSNGSYGNMGRNQLYGPGFGTVDASLVKNTYVHEKLNVQFRAEMFNIFNRLNIAAPSASSFTPSSTSFGRSTDTRGDAAGAPGIGPGEPFNTQFAVKLIF